MSSAILVAMITLVSVAIIVLVVWLIIQEIVKIKSSPKKTKDIDLSNRLFRLSPEWAESKIQEQKKKERDEKLRKRLRRHKLDNPIERIKKVAEISVRKGHPIEEVHAQLNELGWHPRMISVAIAHLKPKKKFKLKKSGR